MQELLSSQGSRKADLHVLIGTLQHNPVGQSIDVRSAVVQSACTATSSIQQYVLRLFYTDNHGIIET